MNIGQRPNQNTVTITNSNNNEIENSIVAHLYR
jgi:hypothetical protein